MDQLELNDLGVEELTSEELKNINGGQGAGPSYFEISHFGLNDFEYNSEDAIRAICILLGIYSLGASLVSLTGSAVLGISAILIAWAT